MTRSEYADFKSEYILKRQEVLKRKLSAIEKKIYADILDKVFSKLDVVDGTVKSEANNLALTAEVDKLFDSFQRNEFKTVVEQIVGDFRGIGVKNKEYYKLVSDIQGNINSVYDKSKEQLNRSLGITPDGKVLPNGYIDRLSKDTTFKTSIKQALTSGIVGNVSLAELKSNLQAVIVGNEKVNGSLTRYFETNVIDTYNAYDRSLSTNFASSLGLNAFIYAGGKIKSSREFCRSHDGKVYTREEAEQWKNILNEEDGPIWNESKDGTYDPFRQMGGYRCRHSVDWISEKEAIRRRPDLKGYFEAKKATV